MNNTLNVLLSIAIMLCSGSNALFAAAPNDVRDVHVRFVKSPIADYLFYLCYRSTGKFSQLEKEVPLGQTPTLDQPVSLPEQVASAQLSSYEEIYPLLKQYEHPSGRVVKIGEGRNRRFRILGYSDELPPVDKLRAIISEGRKSYPNFHRFWLANIAPAEDAQIKAWQRQLRECEPLVKLQELSRLSFPFSHLDVAAIALHLSGSGNTDPAGVYSGLFEKPNLAWVLGHEGTHLTVDRYAGHDWYDNPAAARAIETVKQHGGAANDIEESLALFMQVKVSQSCGYTSSSRRISDSFPADTPKGAILRSLESGWIGYLQKDRTNLIDYLLERVSFAFR